MRILLALLTLMPATAFAAVGISVDKLISDVFYLIVVGIVFWLLWWLIGFCGIPEPFNKVARILVAVVAVFLLIALLLGMAGHPVAFLQ